MSPLVSIHKVSVAVALTVALNGCLVGPGFFRQSTNAKIDSQAPEATLAQVTKDENGVVTALIKPDATTPQVVNASAGSAIARASILVPLGAVGVETALTIEEGQSLATSAEAGALGVAGGVEAAAPAVVVASSVDLSPATPMTLSLPLPDGASLLLTQGSSRERVVVLFKVKRPDAEGGGFFFGLLPFAELEVGEGVVRVKITRFGSYQVVITKELVTAKKEIPAATPVVTAREEKARTTPAAGETPAALVVEATTAPDSPREHKLAVRVENAVNGFRVSWRQDAGPRAEIALPGDAATVARVDAAGDYKFVARVEDGAGRVLESAVGFSVAGARKTFGFDAAAAYEVSGGATISGGRAVLTTARVTDVAGDFPLGPSSGGTVGSGTLRMDPANYQTRSLRSDWFGSLTGLVLHATFEETVGAATQLVTNHAPGASLHGTYAPAPSPGLVKNVGPNERVGQSLLFDTAVAQTDFGSLAALQGNEPFTMMAWVKPYTSSDGVYHVIARRSSSTPYVGYRLYFENVSGVVKISASFADGTNQAFVQAVGPSFLSPQRWDHIAATYQPGRTPSQLQVFLNGVALTPSTSINDTVGAPAYSTNLYVGSLNGSQSVQGEMDEAIIFQNRLLDPAEIKAIYDRQRPGHLATFLSTPFDSESAGNPWTSLSWIAREPYGRRIPAADTNESAAYASGGLDTSSLALLLRHDETAATSPTDSSGRGHLPILQDVENGTINPHQTTGVFGGAFGFHGASQNVKVPHHSLLSFDHDDDFSVAGWVYIDGSGGDGIIFQKFDGNYGFWLKRSVQCLHLNLQGIGDGVVPGLYYEDTDCLGSYQPPMERWAHVAIVYDSIGATSARASIYIDGVLRNLAEVFDPVAYGINGMDNAAPFFVGGDGVSNSNNFVGKVDELAVFRAALSPAQVAGLFRRGAVRTLFTVRACAVASCADNPPFTGIGGSPNDPFQESEATGPGASFGLGLTGRYLQYATQLVSIAPLGTYTPEIVSVTAGPARWRPGKVTTREPLDFGAILGFTETGNTNARYQASFDGGGSWRAFDGTAWVDADSTGLSNDAATFGTGLRRLPPGKLNVRVVLEPGMIASTQAALDELAIDYVAP